MNQNVLILVLATYEAPYRLPKQVKTHFIHFQNILEHFHAFILIFTKFGARLVSP